MRFKRFVIATVALVAGMLLLAAVIMTIARIDVTIEATGVVKPVDYTHVTPSVGGLVVKKLRKSRDMVTEGEVLAVLDSSAAENRLRSAREDVKIREQAIEDLKAVVRRAGERVKVAEARLAQAKAAIGKLKTTSPEKQIANAEEAICQREVRLAQSRNEAVDAEELTVKGLISQVDLEKARAQAKIAESELKIAKNRLVMLKDSLMRDLEAAEADARRWQSELRLARLDQDRDCEQKRLASELEKARLEVEMLERDVTAHTYRAPRTGQLLDFEVWEKQIVQVAYGGGTSVGRIIDTSKYKFEVKVRQIDAPWVKEGCEAYMELVGFAYRTYGYFEGHVSMVGCETVSVAAQDGTPAPVEVEILIEDPKWAIRPGLAGHAEIVVGRARVIEWLLGLNTPDPPLMKPMPGMPHGEKAAGPAPEPASGEPDPAPE